MKSNDKGKKYAIGKKSKPSSSERLKTIGLLLKKKEKTDN
jgi:hypothetical protein